jgi:hypothetical protein
MVQGIGELLAPRRYQHLRARIIFKIISKAELAIKNIIIVFPQYHF